jgi:hypothetical protein
MNGTGRGVLLSLALTLIMAGPLPAQLPADAGQVRALLDAASFPAAREMVLRLWAERGDSLRGEERSEALFLRAILTLDPAAAETDLRRIVVEHPSSPDADAALLRLALLRLEGGEASEASTLLERLEAGYPQSQLLAASAEWRRRIAATSATEEEARPPPARSAWAVQVAALRSEETARNLAGELNRRGFPVEARPRAADGLIRVRLGGFATSSAAEGEARRLRAAGYEAVVVRDAR